MAIVNKTDQAQPANNSDEISLKELILKLQEWWGYLLSKWKVILIAGLIGGLTGLAYAYFKKPIYKAELSFALQDEKSGGGGLSSALGLASQFGIDLGGGGAGGEFSGDNLLELMKSRSMIEKALLTTVNIKGTNETLAELYINFNELRDKWTEKPELSHIKFYPNSDPLKFTLKQDSIIGVFYQLLTKDNLVVDKMDKKLSIIMVKVESKSELFSKYFAENLTKVVSDFYIQTKTEKAAKNVFILQRQTDSVRRILNGAITKVALSTDVNPNSNPFLASLKVPAQHGQIDVQANSAILTQLVTNLEIAKMSLLQATPIIQIIDNPILPLEKVKIGKAKALVLGFILGAFITIIFLISKRIFKQIMVS